MRLTSGGTLSSFYLTDTWYADTTTATNNAWNIGCNTWNGAQIEAFVNGVGSGSPTSASNSLVAASGAAIGCAPVNSGAFFGGKMAEIIIFDAYDSAVRQKVEGYSAHKFALTVLPSGHTYKNIPPLTALATY